MFQKFIIKLLILLNVISNLSYCEVYTSVGHLTTLVESLQDVTKNMDAFIQNEFDSLSSAKELIADFKAISTQSTDNPVNFVANPINSFLLIKKLAKDLQIIINKLSNYDRLKVFVDNIKENNLLATNEDYEGAAFAIHRLGDTYELKPSDLSKGNLSKNYPSRELNTFECFELGRIAYENSDFYHTILWMNEALERINKENVNFSKSGVDKVAILDYLSYALAKQGNFHHALSRTNELLEIDPSHQRARQNVIHYKEELRTRLSKRAGDTGDQLDNLDDPFEIKNERPKSSYPERETYEALCRGEIPKIPDSRLKNLKCRYINHNPFIFIAPVKEELLFDEPKIWLYHDVITEKQVNIMKELGSPRLKRAIVRSPVTGEYVTADYRISKSGWLNDGEHPQLPYLTKLVEAVTNLTLDTAEEWQIANYGIGGQYEPHFDFARKSDPKHAFDDRVGNRIATWLFYLEAPEKGGATVFPPIKVAVQPVRRSAAFWYNLLPSGDGDYRTRHAACPVLFGTKWVSNKWIHTVGQDFKRPCSLTREISEEME